jgi:hypothetical protein
VKAIAAMYSGGELKESNHARPTNRMIPVRNWRKPGIQMPQIPVVMSTPRSRFGKPEQLSRTVDQIARPEAEEAERERNECRWLETDYGCDG